MKIENKSEELRNYIHSLVKRIEALRKEVELKYVLYFNIF